MKKRDTPKGMPRFLTCRRAPRALPGHRETGRNDMSLRGRLRRPRQSHAPRPKAFPLRGRWTRNEVERPDEVSAALRRSCHCEATSVAVAISCTDNCHCETCASKSWQSPVRPDIRLPRRSAPRNDMGEGRRSAPRNDMGEGHRSGRYCFVPGRSNTPARSSRTSTRTASSPIRSISSSPTPP